MRTIGKTVVSLVQVVAPVLARRIGTAFAAVLLAHGIPDATVDQLIVALGVTGGLILDVCASWLARKTRGEA